MTNFYQILEIEKTATQEQIKKAYRKLAMQWHPDKFVNKSLEKREKANKMMQEINQAYEILSDEEDKRKRYDRGETNFSVNADFDFSTHEAEMEDIREEIQREREKINLMEDLLEAHEESAKNTKKLWLLNATYLDRYSTKNRIKFAMNFSFPRVYAEDLQAEGYSKLWEPYGHWLDKVWEMPITIIMGEKEQSDELRNYKEEMIKAINETAVIIETREKTKEASRTNFWLEKTRSTAIKNIEDLMAKKELQVHELGEDFDYKEKVSNLDKKWKIRNLEDEIIARIRKIINDKLDNSQSPKNQPKQDKEAVSTLEVEVERLKNNKAKTENNPQQQAENQRKLIEKEQELKKIKENENSAKQEKSENYDYLTREQLIEKIKQKNLDNKQLQKLFSSLEKQIESLKEELAELKAEKDQTPEINAEIQKREVQLRESQVSLAEITNQQKSQVNPNSDSKFPTKLLLGGGAVVIAAGLLVILIKRNKGKRK